MASRDRLNRSHTNVPRPQHGYTNNSRSRPFQNNRSLSAASLPPSTTTKRKLKAFQFIDGAPSDSLFAEENKENIEILAPVEKALDGEIRPPQISADPLAIPQQPNLAVPLSPNNPQKEFPSTPLNSSKLPLTHLIGRTPIDKPGAGDAAKREGLSWKQQTPRASQPAVTPARKRKRAQSSSPPIDGPPNRVFKTPMQDPASELWMRYRGDSNSKESALKASQSGLEKLLLVDSSPRSAATAGSVGGLRRYSSCGYQWPTSRKKRRQTRPVFSAYPPEPDAVDASGHRTSKVSLLLEEATWLKETERQIFDDDEDQPRAPSSSSPLPLAGRSMDDAIDDESPSRKGAPTDILGRAPNPAKEAPPQQVDVQEDASLEFDNFDADFDEEAGDLHQLLASTAAMLDGGQIPADRSPDGQQMDVTMPDFQEAAAKKVVDEFDDGALSDGEWEFAATLANSNVDAAKNVANVQETSEAILLPSSGYGGDSDDLQAFDAVDGGVQQKSQRERSERKILAIQRYQITAIRDDAFLDGRSQRQPQKILELRDERSLATKVVVLRETWLDTPCTPKAFVHVIGSFDRHGTCVIDNASNMIILHPDHLVSATVVADSFGCIRRAVLQDRVKAAGQTSAPMLYGNMLHELFQEAMKKNTWDFDSLESIMMDILPRHYDAIVELGLNLNQVREYVAPRLLEMGGWAQKFVQSTLTDDALVSARSSQKWRMNVNKLLDVEEHVWSPNYGLKGNIDATVQIVLEDDDQAKTLTVPLEVKTGKRQSEAHQAQTALYTLLVSDRYDIEVFEGILYYLETSGTIRVKAVRHEIIHMIMKRNELACYIRERLRLPPILEPAKQRLCDGCYAQTSCHLYHKLAEHGNGDAINKKDAFLKLTSHLKDMHQRFFQKWDGLLTKEESEMMKFRRELWTMLSVEREKVHRCFAAVVIEPGSTAEDYEGSKINRYQYTFIRPNSADQLTFAESQIGIGEPIVISDENGHFALANGYVTSLQKHRLRVAVDRRLHNARVRRSGFDARTNQTFAGIMELDPSSTTQSGAEPILYRIDKDEFSNGMATVRNNLLQIMDNNAFKAADLRSLIIDGREPRFTPPNNWALPSQTWESEMNIDQKAAMQKVMAAEDYALVLGMPGTGKTTTISQIIRCLVEMGKTILLASYTHSAVDNILLKLRGSGFDILRVGVQAKIHLEVQEFAILAAKQKDSPEEVEQSWLNPPVVATTCLGVAHPVFTQRTFDYCIVDEASQITLPVCLGPIRMAKRFVLVGDHFQLPPLVQDREAKEGGLDVSLFRKLSEEHPEAIVSLGLQYRMCEDVMSVANRLVYSGRLRCGNEAVAERKLRLPLAHEALRAVGAPSTAPQPGCELAARVLDAASCVLFLNTDFLGPSAQDVTAGPRITNPLEANLTARLVTLLLSAGLAPADLGIVTFYRSQLALLRQTLPHRGAALGVELHTADRFQGRDKEAVLVSFVRSNGSGVVGDLLRDWRRVNVAVTRARSKLIMVGSARTLAAGGGDGEGAEVLRSLVRLCKERGWMVDLSPREMDGLLGVEWTQGVSTAASGEVREARFDERTGLKRPGKVCKVGERAVVGSRPILKDILNDVT